MMLGHFLADRVHAALDASLQLHWNGLGRTVVVAQIPAEHGFGKGRRSLGGLHHRNILLVCQFFGLIVVMAVPIMEPASLELNKIRTCHNSQTDVATASTAQRTTINVEFDVAFVDMIANKFPWS